MSNQLMNPDFANHFVALFSCILTNRTKFTYIIYFTYIKSANFLFSPFHVCKQFIWAFLILQTIFFRIFHPPPLQNNNGPSLNTSCSARNKLLMNMVQKTQVKPLLENGPS